GGQQRRSLADCERLGWPPGPSRGRPDQRRDVAADVVVGLRMPNGPLQTIVGDHHRPARARCRDLREHATDVPGGQIAQGDLADAIDDRLKQVPVERDGLLGASVQSLAQPVGYRLGNGVAAVGSPNAGFDVAVKLGELVLILLLCAARHFAAYPLPVRAVAERDRAAPPSGASLVMPRVAAIARVVEVDRIFAEPTPAHNGSLTPLAPSLAPNRSSQDRIVPLTCGAKGT